MKRALAVLLVFVGFSAFGIGTFSGSWNACVDLLPTAGLASNTLTINYTDFGWTFTGKLSLLGGGSSDTFDITAKGAFGVFNVEAGMNFNFTPAYKGAYLKTSMDFAGLGLSFAAYHGAKYVTDVGCQTPDNSLKYVLTAKVDPITAVLTFRDCCTGTEFYSLKLTLSGISLCCGIALDSELYFTKAGFQYLSFSGIKIPLCCGVDFTASVKFTTTGKEVTTGLEFGGFADACFTVYADAQAKKDEAGRVIGFGGIDVYGWKIKCSLGDCSYVEFLTALDVTKVEGIVGDIFKYNEFEYMKLGFCGAGCCGGTWTVALAVYFQQANSLFGITRIGADMSIPIMSNLTVTVSFSTPNKLGVCWKFTF